MLREVQPTLAKKGDAMLAGELPPLEEARRGDVDVRADLGQPVAE
jgi:hypothetical protein